MPVSTTRPTRTLPAHEHAARRARRERETPAATTVSTAPHPQKGITPTPKKASS